eukprot:CAMPEP_0174351916 /NCGR_PEP_ID=MMETSP0811_2-20130205/9427_1 /TAXON_ID=73025 ORGANISM="Eutreptiella gymnastica-like, Strain CCMP1594" /NCGR_SAMPLE_ID=MMETSP0811_2 /ASSEMBLY_ACC=CAM_ASM_000667 /LENGTH=979 /DNA_ID=CAMNT_0015481613 /DNA_START=35 /DNA_END=2974 /DNA_ORIENTATION=+
MSFNTSIVVNGTVGERTMSIGEFGPPLVHDVDELSSPLLASPVQPEHINGFQKGGKKGSQSSLPSSFSDRPYSTSPLVVTPPPAMFQLTDLDGYFCSTQRPSLWHRVERLLKESVGCALATWRYLYEVEAFFGEPGFEKMQKLNTMITQSDPESEASEEIMDEISDVLETFCKPPRFSGGCAFDVLVYAGDPEARYYKPNTVEQRKGRAETWIEELASDESPTTKLRMNVVCVYSFAQVLIAMLVNARIQSVVLCDNSINTDHDHGDLVNHVLAYKHLIKRWVATAQTNPAGEIISTLVAAVKSIRPEVDIFLVTERIVDALELYAHVRRSFFPTDDFYAELRSAIIGGVQARQKMPFFTALTQYAARPIGVFHALAISRGSSLLKSHWLGEFVDFYGINIFRAESSATCGGLDSLLDPTGSLKEAQQLASSAFGSAHTFFVTNGTSTANKIVIQALVIPGDIVLVDRDCHKSHHYGLVHAGGWPCYLDAYPLHQYLMYGGVSLREIKSKLLLYKRCGMLHRVKMLILTNCTFDGIVYNVVRVMEECLAIKPDLVFLWDEAWYAYAAFNPVLRKRTGMGAARLLARLLKTDEYRAQSANFWTQNELLFDSMDEADHERLLDMRLLPRVDDAVLRVYCTQSTHKSLTAFRQGSMIHIFDQRFRGGAEMAFHEAYYTHTSTSPNYQILASLDAGRSQMQLEGFEFVLEMLEHAMYLRKHAGESEFITKWLWFLDVADLIPAEYRTDSRCTGYWDNEGCVIRRFEDCWMSDDEFVLDPTRLTLYTAATGLTGHQFKVDWLMNKCGIQINKTSRNSVLFQTNIGTSFSSVAYLLQSIRKCVHEFAVTQEETGGNLSVLWQKKVRQLKEDHTLLPDFTAFHMALRHQDSLGPEGDMRRAFYLAYDEANCEYLSLREAKALIQQGKQLTATTFTIPYPPGFPVLVPGQLVSVGVLDFMMKLDVKEIHGFDSDQGLRVFKEEALVP